MQKVFGVPNHVKIIKEKKGRATVIKYNSNMYVLRHRGEQRMALVQGEKHVLLVMDQADEGFTEQRRQGLF